MRLRVVLALLAAIAAPCAQAQEWPSKTVRIVVPFGPGSTPDLVMRVIADKLQAKHKHSFVIENKPGAGGNTGTDIVAKAEPDGATIGLSIMGPLATNALLMTKLPYDPAADFAYITLLVDQPSIVAVNADVPAKNTAELVALIKKEPGKYSYGSIGPGSLSHLCMEAVAMKSGASMVHIPYAASPQAVTALMRGDVHVVCLPALAVVSQASSGKLKMLAVTSPKRSALLPELPTLKEGGVDVEANAWNGLIAPAKTPPAVIEQIRKEVAEALADPDVKQKLAVQYMEPLGG
ncbi:MAG: tripartite tricarboxylate transporter substrate binding protein, partial [Pseudolabrys sp.]|nr:tripartite tricarboxylate transporter substrate binding protein [Pseudolabrys sp.]